MSDAKRKLSDCIRPTVEAAPWVIEAVLELENELAAALAAIKVKDDYLNLLIGYTSESTVASLIVQKALAATEPKP